MFSLSVPAGVPEYFFSPGPEPGLGGLPRPLHTYPRMIPHNRTQLLLRHLFCSSAFVTIFPYPTTFISLEIYVVSRGKYVLVAFF